MDIIKELEDLKNYVAGLARTDQIYCTMPPQHGFAAGATVEAVIRKIDLIEDRIKEESKKNDSINCKALIEYIKAYTSVGGPCSEKFIEGLYKYIEKINTEISMLKNNVTHSKWIDLFQRLSSK